MPIALCLVQCFYVHRTITSSQTVGCRSLFSSSSGNVLPGKSPHRTWPRIASRIWTAIRFNAVWLVEEERTCSLYVRLALLMIIRLLAFFFLLCVFFFQRILRFTDGFHYVWLEFIQARDVVYFQWRSNENLIGSGSKTSLYV